MFPLLQFGFQVSACLQALSASGYSSACSWHATLFHYAAPLRAGEGEMVLATLSGAAESVAGLLLSVQAADIKGLVDERTPGASLYGATDFEKKTVIAGKLAHYGRCWDTATCSARLQPPMFHSLLMVLCCSAQLPCFTEFTAWTVNGEAALRDKPQLSMPSVPMHACMLAAAFIPPPPFCRSTFHALCRSAVGCASRPARPCGCPDWCAGLLHHPVHSAVSDICCQPQRAREQAPGCRTDSGGRQDRFSASLWCAGPQAAQARTACCSRAPGLSVMQLPCGGCHL
jgi:hypothetical protein